MGFSLYGFLFGLSFVLGLWNVERWLMQQPQHSKQNLKREKLEGIIGAGAVMIFIFAIIGARLYHFATDARGFNLLEFVAVWNGGLGFFGGLVGGGVGLLAWHRLWQPPWKLLTILDLAAAALPWSQALGRLGNFFNQEIYGPPTTLPWGIPIDAHLRPLQFSNQTHFHPLFLYETIGSLLLGTVLFSLLKHANKQKQHNTFKPGNGIFLATYLIGYGTIRFLLEFLRVETAPGLLGLSIAQIVSLFAVILGLTSLLFVFCWNRSLQWSHDRSF